MLSVTSQDLHFHLAFICQPNISQTETMTGTPVATVLHYVKVPGGTGAVPTITSMASTSVEITTVMVPGGATSTQLRVATHSSGLK